jgi:hypothetical protein
MLTKTIKTIVSELEDFPDDKVDSLLNYLNYLKFESKPDNAKRKPNKTTVKTFKDTDKGKNINRYSSLDGFFKKMES